MSLCHQCGIDLPGINELCPHHGMAYDADWHVENRIMCNFFHRKQDIPRLPLADRTDFWSEWAPHP